MSPPARALARGRRPAFRGIVLATLIASLGLPAAAAEPAPGGDLADLAWIAGTWTEETGERAYEERWTPPADNAMLGMARVISGTRMVFFEYLRIEAREDGVYYVAQPLGRPPTDFRMTRRADGEVTFENPEHDFPKRITYRRNADGTMTARTDAGEGVEEDARTFTFVRVPRD